MTFDPAVNQETGASSRRYNLNRGLVEFGAFATPTESRWGSNNYITQCHRQHQLVGVSGSWISSCSSRQWEPSPSKGLAPSGPPFEQSSRMRKKCCYSKRNLGSICCSLFSLQLTSHTQTFLNPFATLSNKVWDVYFSKELCLFAHYCWLCFRIYMYTYSCITAIQQIDSHGNPCCQRHLMMMMMMMITFKPRITALIEWFQSWTSWIHYDVKTLENELVFREIHIQSHYKKSAIIICQFNDVSLNLMRR